MRRVIAALFLAGYCSVLSAAPVTYKLNSFTSTAPGVTVPNGNPLPGQWTVTAQITTDGKIGALANSDVLDFKWYVNGVLAGDTADGATVSIQNLIASATTIALPSAKNTHTSSLTSSLTFEDPYTGGLASSPFFSVEASLSLAFDNPEGEFYQLNSDSAEIGIPGAYLAPEVGYVSWTPALVGYSYGTDGYVIATAVPEPSTLVLVALGGLALLARRRRR